MHTLCHPSQSAWRACQTNVLQICCGSTASPRGSLCPASAGAPKAQAHGPVCYVRRGRLWQQPCWSAAPPTCRVRARPSRSRYRHRNFSQTARKYPLEYWTKAGTPNWSWLPQLSVPLWPACTIIGSQRRSILHTGGWGNQNFYMANHPAQGMAIAALFPSSSVVFVEGLSEHPKNALPPDIHLRWVCVSRTGVWRLDAYLVETTCKWDHMRCRSAWPQAHFREAVSLPLQVPTMLSLLAIPGRRQPLSSPVCPSVTRRLYLPGRSCRKSNP